MPQLPPGFIQIPLVVHKYLKEILDNKAKIANTSRNRYIVDLILKDITIEDLEDVGFTKDREFRRIVNR
jgi:hypothetical protein